MVAESARQRKVQLLQPDEKDKHRPRRNKNSLTNQSGLKFSFGCLVLCVVIVVIFFGMYTDSFPPIIDNIAVKLGYKDKQYAVIIDAGSTGSRVLAYEFHLGYMDGRLVLDNELFREVKPGLSSFADNPTLGAEKIVDLMKEAKLFIPADMWHTSPIVLKATAGLRLLDTAKADNILNEVREVIKKSGFLVDDDAVEIMEGTYEGIFSWFTVNFLLARLSGQRTVAALDLGGGSTQVTFSPKDPQQIPSFNDYMHTVPTGDSKIEVFTHSYLGLGLMAVRYAVFSNTYPNNATSLTSECVNPIISNKLWKYANVEYAVSGKENGKSTSESPVVDFEKCLKTVKSKVIALVTPKPITLTQSPISAFSYYFERAIETGLVDPFTGGEIEVRDFRKKAQEICAIPNTDQPFMCLDVTYISVLLEDGFGLKPQTKLKLYKKIDGHEISWALGCAYNLLTKQLTQKESN